MIGQRIESQYQVPWAGVLFLIAGLGLVAGGLSTGTDAMLAGSAMPLAIGGSLCIFGRDRPLAATFREEGLEVEGAEAPVLIPYATIQNVKLGGRPADPVKFRGNSGSISVLHAGGVLRIPARLNYPSHEVLRFLVDCIPPAGGRAVNPVLADYLQRQEMYFDPECIATFRAASQWLTGPRRGYRAFCIGLVLGGVAWSALGFSGVIEAGWAAGGIACLVAGVILYTFSFAEGIQTGPLLKEWRKASVVVGPAGLAMVQGRIQGEVRWPELLEIRFQPKPGGFHLGQSAVIPGILLRVKGADIVIADIYDRPLCVIYHRIMAAAGRTAPLDDEL